MRPLGAAYPFAPDVGPTGRAGWLSVVVVHHAGVEDLRACVASVLAQDDGALELIVVENGARDGAAARLPPDPRVRRLQLPHNLGFAPAANLGIAEARGELLLLLNPDAALRPGCLQALRAGLAEADVVVPRVLLAGDPRRLDSCGHSLYPDGLNWCRGRGEEAAGRFEAVEDVLLASGAAVALRRSALLAVGGLDPSFWAYGEDADLSLRLARFGLVARTAPRAVVTHRVGGSFGQHGLRKAFLVERNRVRVALVHLPVGWLLRAPAFTFVRLVGLGASGALGRGALGGYSARDRALLPGALLLALLAAGLAVPGSLRRRAALDRAAGPRSPAFLAQLDGARIGIRTLLSRPPL